MKIIISPAKSLNFEKDLPTNNFSLPVFIEDSKVINENLKKKNPSPVSYTHLTLPTILLV